MDANYYIVLGAVYVLLGLLSLRRVYVGEKMSAIKPLSDPADSRMTRRQRLMFSVLGSFFLPTGILYLVHGLHQK